MILGEYELLEMEGNAFDFGSLKARYIGIDFEDDVLASDLYVSSKSDSESDNETNDVVDDYTFGQRGIKGREDKPGLLGRFRRHKKHKRHKYSGDNDVCNLDKSEGESDEVDTCLIDKGKIEYSDADSENYDSDSYDRDDLDNSITRESSTSETDDNLEDSTDIKRFTCDLWSNPFETLNANVSLDVYGWNDHVSTYHTEQSETDFLDILVNEDENNFTDYSDLDYSDDDISESSSDEETEKVSTAGLKLPPIPRRMKVLAPLRVILLKYRTVRDASRDWSSCCSLYCRRDWPLRKILSAMDEYAGL
ncbi:hypothetical protein CHS0354_041384 [Potamilus streckersoni]|uniref:Uncharacterized protein n=1 Tax=Potamilus streckersoni TaxID=2493646 RepID=A0AAE0TB07_9BIVA|nr:hypothetical protein CHS0354_041384 [Potamilus streckersoni]